MSEMLFVLVKSYLISPVCLQPIMKKAVFLRFLRSLLITDLFDNLESRKNYRFEQKSGKLWSLFPDICAKHLTVVKKRISSRF